MIVKQRIQKQFELISEQDIALFDSVVVLLVCFSDLPPYRSWSLHILVVLHGRDDKRESSKKEASYFDTAHAVAFLCLAAKELDCTILHLCDRWNFIANCVV